MKYTIQTKILTGFILGLMAIGLIGYEVHNQMTGLASSLYKKNDQQNNLVLFQKVLSTLAAAESSVRTFSITNNPDDIDPFFTAKEMLDSYLTDLDNNLGKNEHYKNLHNHIDYKIYLMQRMIELKKRNPAENVLEEALKEISQINKKRSLKKRNEQDSRAKAIKEMEDQESDLPESIQARNPGKLKEDTLSHKEDTISKDEQNKEGFFHRLFNRRKSVVDSIDENDAAKEGSSENLTTEDTTEKEQERNKKSSPTTNGHENEYDKASIEQFLQKLKREKSMETAIWQEAMLMLINEDARVMNEIRKDMSELERQELDYNSQFIAVAARSKNRIITNTKIIAIGAFTIIFFLSLVVFHDFKKIRKNRQSLIDEKDKASRLAKVKEEFLANMSHEIRTPMNAIVGYSELLEKTPLDQDQIEYVSTIQQSSNHLMVILNDILDYSKLESGKLTINKHAFSPKKCIEQVVKSMKRDAEKKKTEVSMIFHNSVADRLIGDSVRFQQILYNLVSNAIKFTHKGEVVIEAKGINEVEGHILQVKVKDNGIGIKKDYLNKIFENFEQLNTGRERKYGGTGLGLAIVKQLIDLQQGTIHVKSEEGKGSSFVIRIPYEIAAARKEKQPQKKPDDGTSVNFKDLSILAVDDQEYNLELIKIILNKWEIDVDVATSGNEAIKLFNNNHYDLILMDVQMPQMSGLEATHEIRTSDKKEGKTIPIVALTAASTKEETEKCLKAGMNDYLLKPFKQDELRQMIIKQKSSGNHHFNDPAKLKAVTFNLKHLKALSNGEDSFVVNMLEVFVKNIQHDLGKLQHFIENENWKSAGFQAHKMVAPSKHLGINSLATLLEDLERKGINEQNIEELPELFKEIKHVAFEVTHLLEKEINKINNQNSKQAS